jgi:hypothetical protein
MSDRTRDERLWAMAIASARFGVWDLDPRRDTVHYSAQWKARLGFPRLHAPDPSSFWRCRVHPEDVGPMLESLHSHLDGRASTYQTRFRLRSNGSGYRTMQSRGRVVERDSLGNATRMIGTLLDLTGWPASTPDCGLASEESGTAPRLHRLPFHAAMGVTTLPPGEPGDPVRKAEEPRRLVDMIDDLLHATWREAKALP